jgi:uncharacterized RDD family membrane protein YckC
MPPGQHLLEESGVVPPNPEADSEGDEAQRARLASLGDRFLALILDSIVVLLLWAVIDVWTFMKWGVVSGTEVRVTTAVVLAGVSLNALLAFLYVWLLEAGFGCTLGKAIIGIGVVNNSERSALAASAIRNLLRVVDGFGFYLIGTLVASCSRFRRRIGDFCGGTYVVEGNISQLVRSMSLVAWLAILAGGAWALPGLWNRPKPSHPPRHLGHVVVKMGRAQNAVYISVPNREIDLYLISPVSGGTPAASDDEIRRASKLAQPETSAVIP